MTKRCKHEYETKSGYPDDIICQKCGTIWTISDYLKWTAKELMTLPKYIRTEVLKIQAEKFAKENPDYYLKEAEFESLLDKAIEEAKREERKGIGIALVKVAKWREIPSLNYVGDEKSTGGKINLTETHYLIPQSTVDKLLQGKALKENEK
jgi:hypothetical protein